MFHTLCERDGQSPGDCSMDDALGFREDRLAVIRSKHARQGLSEQTTKMSLRSQALFRHGVASGDPLSTAVIIWSRVTPPQRGALAVKWEVSTEPDLVEIVACGTAMAEESSDYTIKVDVTGLHPYTDYYYRFETLSTKSRIGHTKTLPAGDPTRHVRIGVCSCAKYTSGYFNAYARMAERADLDFVVHLGDYIYEVGTDDGKAPGPRIGRVMDPPHECRTLSDYRRRYAHYRLDPDLQQLHAHHALIATVDDHEICFDSWRGGSPRHRANGPGEWEERQAAALRAWREWLPVRVQASHPERIYRAFSVGDLADLIVLDGRTMRDRQSRDPMLTADATHSLLGPEQMDWVRDQLNASAANWRLFANSVMIGQMYSRSLSQRVAERLAELNLLSAAGAPDPDQWDGYSGEREALFVFLEHNGVPDNVFLSGDVHTAWAINLSRDPMDREAPPVGIEVVTASVTSENYDDRAASSAGSPIADVERFLVRENPHVRWTDLDGHGYIVLDVTPEVVQADWYVVPEIGRRSPREYFESGWRVMRGESRLRPAHGPAPSIPAARHRG